MASTGSLARVFGTFVGIGPGSGMALTFVATGITASMIGLLGYSIRVIRNAEDVLPDHDAPAMEVQKTPT